jgi:hypothetical protein
LHEPALYKVRNNTGSTLTKGTVVQRSGHDGVIIVSVSTNPISDNRVGIILDSILDGDVGYAAAQGDFGQFDTSGYSLNDVLYSDGSGALTTTVLGDPIATVIRVDADDGHLFCYVPLPISSGGGGADGHQVYTYMLTPTDVSNGYVVLPINPASPADTIVLYEGAASQIYAVDYTVTGANVNFTGLLPYLDSGEYVTILYR